ncbi:hypothetical protein ACR6C2_05640 [Streptomyces sp. INA 01156]
MGNRRRNGSAEAARPRLKGASKSQIRKSRKAINAENSPARTSSRPVRRICSAKIIPMVMTAPAISPNHTTPGMVSPVDSARAARAWSAADTWSTSG